MQSPKKAATAVVGITCALAFLSGCTTSDSLRTRSLESVEIQDYEWALYMSTAESADSYFQSNQYGYIVFVRADGSYDLVKHDGMDQGQISWTSDSLYFADRSADYFVTEAGIEKSSQPRTALMDGLVTLSDSHTRVSAYNAGYASEGYNEELVIADSSTSQIEEVRTNRFYSLLSACGDDVYGASSFTDDNRVHKLSVDQLVKNNSPNYESILIEEVSFSEVDFLAQDAPCRNNQIYFLAEYSLDETLSPPENEAVSQSLRRDGSDMMAFSVVKMDVLTGKSTSIPLLDIENESFYLSGNEFGFSRYDEFSLSDDGSLIWIAGNGDVLRTNVETGVTQVVSNYLHHDESRGEDVGWVYQMSSSNSHIHILVEPNNSESTPSRIVTIDKKTGAVKHDVELTDLRTDVSQNVYYRDIANRPE